jgi:hypothetical protein
MGNTLMRLTALSVLAAKLLRHRRPTLKPVEQELSEADVDHLYGIPGEVLLERMGTFDFAPGAVDEMMAAIEAFKRVPEGDE